MRVHWKLEPERVDLRPIILPRALGLLDDAYVSSREEESDLLFGRRCNVER